jgi:hypothetical protein
MARKIKEDFDEGALVDMMGVVPQLRQQTAPAVVMERQPNAAADVPNPAPALVAAPVLPPATAADATSESCETEDKPPVKRKKTTDNYDDTFLTFKRIKMRGVLHVDIDTFEKLNGIVRSVFDDNITMSNFVDNIINHHILKYKDLFLQRLESKPRSFLQDM